MDNDRKVYWAHEVPEDIAKAIEEAKMDPKHEKLNELMLMPEKGNAELKHTRQLATVKQVSSPAIDT